MKPDELAFIGRPDIVVVQRHEGAATGGEIPATSAAVLEVEVPMAEEVEEDFIEVREITTGRCITILELPDPREPRRSPTAGAVVHVEPARGHSNVPSTAPGRRH